MLRGLGFSLLLLVFVVPLCTGCSHSRTVTISTIPPDATLRIDGRDRGHGPVTETFAFAGDTDEHRVQAEREGYRSQVKTIGRRDNDVSMVIDLKPIPRTITFSVRPLPATVKLDG